MSLASILSLCQENLHTGIFSLRQLVAVHRSLLCQTKEAQINVDCKSIQYPTSLDPIISLVCNNEEDQDLCKRIIRQVSSSSSADTESLLMVQFLSFRLSFSDSARCVLIPFLLLENSNLSEELTTTLLDLIQVDGKFDDESKDLLEIIESLKRPNLMTGRILCRLLVGSSSSKILVEALHEKLRQTIEEAAMCPVLDKSVISTLSKDLLPVLTQRSPDGISVLWTEVHRPFTLKLWNQLFSLDMNKKTNLLLITTILCPLLPHLTECELPLIGGDDTFRRPTEQPELWRLVYICLAEGKSILEKGDISMASIMRKRGLFLLNILAEDSNDWKNYVMCYETLEMESEQHLVDQIWDTVDDLLEAVEDSSPSSKEYRALTWEWMSLLFSRVLSTDQTVIRKLGLYRLLKIQNEQEATAASEKRKGKKKTGHMQTRASSIARKMLHMMPPSFVLDVILPSWNSLRTSVGYNMHLENASRKVEKEDMIPLLVQWLHLYLEQLVTNDAQEFWKGIWSWHLIQNIHIKNIVIIYKALAQKLSTGSIKILADDEALESLTITIQKLFKEGTCVISHRKVLLNAFSLMLANCVAPKDKMRWAPMSILNLLSFFSADHFTLDLEDWSMDNEEKFKALGAWIAGMEQDAANIGAAVASAFVGGDLGGSNGNWEPTIGSTDSDRELAWAISVLCSLAAKNSDNITTGQLLWPAINKGLSNTAGAILSKDKAGHVTRALLLLENGCKLRQISGVGNGDLVADRKTQQLMPPPVNIEKMLSNSVDFILYHISTLLSTETLCVAGNNTESIKPKRVLMTFTRLIGQIMTLQQSFPSSNIVPDAVEDLFKSSFEALVNGAQNDIQCVVLVAMMYASLSSGANPGSEKYVLLCRSLLTAKVSDDDSNVWVHSAQSVLQYSKWAAISCIIPLLISTLERDSELLCQEADRLFKDILDDAFDAIENTPSYACRPLFNCILLAGKQRSLFFKADENEREEFYVANLRKVISGLLALMKKSHTSQETMDMLNESCEWIFQPKLLAEEFQRIERNKNCATPIRDAFRKLVDMAGTQRTHITKAVLCRITVAWLGENEEMKSSLGLNAIPYRDDIVKLLLHKEAKMDESARNQSKGSSMVGVTEIPSQTNELSVTRAFVLVFLSKLPDTNAGLNKRVLTELLHNIILKLLKETAPKKSNAKSLIMKGTPAYCLKMRGWQALCNLSRFVTDDIASQVCNEVFEMMPEHIHGQVRYFIEIFTIQCARVHPEVFGSAFLREVARRDLSLQHISSLMIIGGNWTVGRYKNKYFDPKSDNEGRMKQLLAAIIPWLSSTQGFSRAIAQLMVHKLTPMVIDVQDLSKVSPTENDWFPKAIYRFLEENREMMRLRKKQGAFFERYSVEEMCTPEGVLSLPVDEGEEADPVHMVDAMKEILKGIYADAHDDDIPAWKQVQQLVSSEEDAAAEKNQSSVNFQRKIIPLDSLNLAMEDLREKRLRNAAGQKKQQLIVCASLIDKVPNLGGLARTSEIFAADRLVIPDLAVCKMDNFKSLSVGAGDWIEMEEVRQEHLLSWLLAHKAKGYFVFGLEQTSSSVSLTEMVFPDRPTILLLGKEKEGIPVEYLQAVDQCVEIPQLGIIRSLNVHVSGAIAIWEHTKQRRLQSKS